MAAGNDLAAVCARLEPLKGHTLPQFADLLLDETVQATPTTRRRARLRWKKSSH